MNRGTVYYRDIPAGTLERNDAGYVFRYGDAYRANSSLPDISATLPKSQPEYRFPNEPTATGLDFFADGHFTPRYEDLGFYSSADFLELAQAFGVPPGDVREMLEAFPEHRDRVEAAVAASRLSSEAKELYLAKFLDRLRALAQ